MFGGNDGNPLHPAFLDENRLQYHTNAPNQLHLFGNLAAGCSIDPVNYFGNEHLNNPMIHPNKRGIETEDMHRQQKLNISLNYNNFCKDETDRSANVPKQNMVSTGLRLSYEDDEHNSSLTSASGNANGTSSMFMSLGDNLRMELDRQKEEMDRCIKIQAENLAKGVRDMKQKHIASFISALEKGIEKKLLEKDREIESINRKNHELAERIKNVAAEAQNWHYRAKYNESVVNLLKANLQQAITNGAPDQGKEGFGDSEIDDAASYIEPVANQGGRENSGWRTCRACKVKEVSMLLVPCRHLCLCKECDVFVSVCPVCQLMKNSSVQVFFS